MIINKSLVMGQEGAPSPDRDSPLNILRLYYPSFISFLNNLKSISESQYLLIDLTVYWLIEKLLNHKSNNIVAAMKSN